MPLGCPCMFVITAPLWIAGSGLWEGCLRCEGGGTEVWIWIWGQLLCSQISPTRSGIYWAPIVYLFVCLRLCRLPFHWVHLFLSCSHVTGSLLNSLSISFWGARAHNYYFVHTSTHTHIHTYTYILFCLPKMTNRRCARTSLPPMRNKDVLGPASPHWVIEQHRIASTCLYELFE